MKAIVKPSTLIGKIEAPKSKSLSHRYLICKFLASSLKPLDNMCDDVKLTYDALSKFKDGAKIYVGNSGSTFRFLLPLALALNFKIDFILSDELKARPFDFVETSLICHGADIIIDGNVISTSGKLEAGEYFVDSSISSQLISGLLFALPLLDGDSKIYLDNYSVSLPYIQMTVDILNKFGIEIQKNADCFVVSGNQNYKDIEIDIEGDYSSLAYFYVLNTFGNNISIEVKNCSIVQGDEKIVDFLSCDQNVFNLKNNIDLAPILAIYLASKNNKTYLTGIENLRYKESDRIMAIIDLLAKIGINAKYSSENFGTLIIEGGKFSKLEKYSSKDHRMLMSAIVVSLLVGGEVDGVECINKSYPGFISDLIKLGANICLID